MQIDFSNRTVMVTGAAGGLGTAISGLFAECGARVALCDQKGAGEAAARLRDLGYQAEGFSFDVRDRNGIEEGVSQIASSLGGIDILINNAGINGGPEERQTVDAYHDDLWDRIISVDLDGVYNCSKAVLRNMGNGGTILNISSITGLVPLRNQCAFTAAKAGVINLTKAMALELAPRGIRVNCICPGTVGIAVTNTLWQNSDTMKALLAHIPMGRQALPEEIAGPTVFLCSEYASYITGAVLTVDGGWTAGGYARNF